MGNGGTDCILNCGAAEAHVLYVTDGRCTEHPRGSLLVRTSPYYLRFLNTLAVCWQKSVHLIISIPVKLETHRKDRIMVLSPDDPEGQNLMALM